jgi:hypothetical protein
VLQEVVTPLKQFYDTSEEKRKAILIEERKYSGNEKNIFYSDWKNNIDVMFILILIFFLFR